MINIDFSSPAWHQMCKWAESEIEKARIKNDALTNSPEVTAALRGEIRVLKRFLGLPEEATREVVVEPDN